MGFNLRNVFNSIICIRDQNRKKINRKRKEISRRERQKDTKRGRYEDWYT